MVQNVRRFGSREKVVSAALFVAACVAFALSGTQETKEPTKKRPRLSAQWVLAPSNRPLDPVQKLLQQRASMQSPLSPPLDSGVPSGKTPSHRSPNATHDAKKVSATAISDSEAVDTPGTLEAPRSINEASPSVNQNRAGENANQVPGPVMNTSPESPPAGTTLSRILQAAEKTRNEGTESSPASAASAAAKPFLKATDDSEDESAVKIDPDAKATEKLAANLDAELGS
ncbi:hypothetical protein DIPPA_62834 [Diplonema papillatum]|nr:hypothetical protein DIPPA_62834 [Diplonema papillatum]